MFNLYFGTFKSNKNENVHNSNELRYQQGKKRKHFLFRFSEMTKNKKRKKKKCLRSIIPSFGCLFKVVFHEDFIGRSGRSSQRVAESRLCLKELFLGFEESCGLRTDLFSFVYATRKSAMSNDTCREFSYRQPKIFTDS